MLKKENIFIFISLVYVLFIGLPLVYNYIPLPTGAINLFVSICLFVLYPKAFDNVAIRWFVIYIFVLFLYISLEKDIPSLGIGTIEPSRRLVIEIAFCLPPLSILSVLHFLNDSDIARKIGIYSLFILIFSFVLIASKISENFTYMRDELVEEDNSFGINYTLMHAYIFIIPALLYGIKVNEGKNRLFFLAAFILTLWIIVGTQITTCMLLLLFYLILFFFYNENNIQKSIIIIALSIIFLWVLYASGIINAIVDSLHSFFSGTAAESKIEDLQSMLSPDENVEEEASNWSGRSKLHMKSVNTLFENILVGGKAYNLGNHSYILDRLGGLGLFGFIPFILYFVKTIKLSYTFINAKVQKSFFIFSFIGVFIFCTVKGILGAQGILFAFVINPCIIIGLRKKTKD